MHRKIRSATLAVAVAMATLTATLAVSTPASAAGCWGSGGSQTDYLGNTYGTRYCNVYVGGDVMAAGVSSGYL